MGKAKRRFAARSSTKKPPELPPLFLDANADGKKLTAALRDMGLEVHLCRDHFKKQTKDDVVFELVGEKGWIWVSKDGGIRKRVTELAAIKRHRLAAIVFKSAELTAQEMVDAVRKGVRRIEGLIKSGRRPLIILLGKNGEVEEFEGPHWW